MVTSWSSSSTNFLKIKLFLVCLRIGSLKKHIEHPSVQHPIWPPHHPKTNYSPGKTPCCYFPTWNPLKKTINITHKTNLKLEISETPKNPQPSQNFPYKKMGAYLKLPPYHFSPWKLGISILGTSDLPFPGGWMLVTISKTCSEPTQSPEAKRRTSHLGVFGGGMTVWLDQPPQKCYGPDVFWKTTGIFFGGFLFVPPTHQSPFQGCPAGSDVSSGSLGIGGLVIT